MRLIPALLFILAMSSAVHADDIATPKPSAETAATPQTPQKPDDLRFEDFPAKIFQHKPSKNIGIHPNDSWAQAVRPDIREAMKHGADFAGHFSVVLVNCGTACIAARMIDLRTGQLFWIPGGYQLDLEYYVGSRLMRVAWVEPSENAVCVHQDFEWTGRRFVKRYEDREKTVDSSECPGLAYIGKSPQ